MLGIGEHPIQTELITEVDHPGRDRAFELGEDLERVELDQIGIGRGRVRSHPPNLAGRQWVRSLRGRCSTSESLIRLNVKPSCTGSATSRLTDA